MVEHYGKEISDTLETAQKTGNPLFLWGALFRLLEAHAETKEDGSLTVRTDVTIPPAIADYLLLSAFNMQMLSWGKEPVEIVRKNWANPPNYMPLPKWKEDLFRAIGMETSITSPPKTSKKLTTTTARKQVIKALGLSYGTQGGGPFKKMQTMAKDYSAYMLSISLQKSGLSKTETEEHIKKIFNLANRGVKALIKRGEAVAKGNFSLPKRKSEK